MGKLHELLAVHDSVKNQANKTRGELATTFEKRRHLFEGFKKSFQSTTDLAGKAPEVEEAREIQSTVKKELDWISTFIGKHIDIGYQIDVGNTVATADVILDDGTTLLTDVPTTALLQLKHRLKEVQDLVVQIPTLDPAKGFSVDYDSSSDGNICKAREVRKTRTQKVFDYIVMVQPTEKHPAQVKELTKDVVVGTILEQEWSGLISPAVKSDMLARVEELIRAVDKARSRANDLSLYDDKRVGDRILDYVFNAKK